MDFASIEIDQGVALVWLDQPGEKVNKLSVELIDEFQILISQLEDRPEIQAAVLISRKSDNFIVGADIDQFLQMTEPGQTADMSRRGNRVLQRLANLRKPTIAAIHGAALGGGLEVALACQYRIVTDDPKTQLGLPEVQLGLLPAGGGTQRLPRLIGLQRCLNFLLTGKKIYPQQALRIGLADILTPAPTLRTTSLKVARKLAQGGSLRTRPRRPLWSRILESNRLGRHLILREASRNVARKTRGNYPAPERILECVRVGLNRGIEAGFEAEAEAFDDLMRSSRSGQLVNLFFSLNQGKKHPDPENVRGVSSLGILGAGLMGSGIAEVSSSGGFRVILRDLKSESVSKAEKAIWNSISRKVRKRIVTPFSRDQFMSRIEGTTRSELLAGCQLVIEAVFEDLELKRRVLKEVEDITSPDTILASNTSSLPIARIAEASRHPETVIGMHYFSPVQKMPLLEIIATGQTADWVIATARQVGLAQGKTVIVVGDGPGFYTTRILAPMLNEAMEILNEGAAIDDIDLALQDWGFPVGPLTLLDEVGIDVASHITEVLSELFVSQGVNPVNRVQPLVEAGLLGRKTGRGFYSYGKPKKQINSGVYQFFGGSERRRFPAQEIQERLVLQLVNQAVVCLQEGILRSPLDGDLGAVLGLGFPPFRGGPFRYLDQVGAARTVERLQHWKKSHERRFRTAPMLLDAARHGSSFYP